MVPSPWHSFCRPLPDGRFLLTRADLIVLERDYVGRSMETRLASGPVKVFFLHVPLQLPVASREQPQSAFHLSRIRIKDLPGWPPRAEAVPEMPPLFDCRFSGVRFKRAANGEREGLEFDLEGRRESFKAVQTGCPLELLWCEVVTLQEEETRGRNLADVQELRLIGAEI